jgi:hypothetical protein
VDVGGNGIVISGYARNASVTQNSLSRFGAAAIVVAGHSKLVDMTSEDYPKNTVIENNICHDGGVYLKGYFGPLVLAKQQAAVVRGNIFFNSPRAAIMINDGALGGDLIEGNLLFNANRETADTGVVYTYDRLVFEFLDPDGRRTVVPQRRTIRRNMILANYNTAWPIDHDDGSSYYDDRENVLMYGGTKTYLGGHSKTTAGNLILWPNTNGWGAATMCYASVINASGYDELWTNNTVVLGPSGKGTPSRGNGYTDYSSCDLNNLANPPNPALADNTVWISAAVDTFTTRCGGDAVDVAMWQASGRDVGSVFKRGTPSGDKLVTHARQLLGLTPTL